MKLDIINPLTMLWLASAMPSAPPGRGPCGATHGARVQGRSRYDPAGLSLSRPSLRGKSPVVFCTGFGPGRRRGAG